MEPVQTQSVSDASHQIVKINKKEYWVAKIQQWEKSGLSQSAFCKKYSVTPSSFYYWKSRLLNQKKNKPAKSNRFTPIEIQKTRPTQDVMRLMLPSGVRIEIPLTISSDKLTGILKSFGVFK